MKKLIIAFLIFIASPVFAQELNPKQEDRYNALGREIRCVVCQSEPVATSSAKIAIDMRDVIKERILAGDSDTQIRKYFADHYGEYVLLRPQVNKVTYLLWLAPILLLVFGVFFALKNISNKKIEEEILSDDELKQAEAIVKELD